MFNHIKIENFRALKHLEITGLGEVNLFVGRNNAGKTSILEAVELLASGGHPGVLLRLPRRREERVYTTETRPRLDVDIRHLFTGHGLEENTWLKISGQYRDKIKSIECKIIPYAPDKSQQDIFTEVSDPLDFEKLLAVQLAGTEMSDPIIMPFSDEGVLMDKVFRVTQSLPQPATSINFIGTEGADSWQLKKLWDTVVLTPEEEKIYEALYPIAPNLERIAFTGTDSRYRSTTASGALVKLKDSDRLPLGSMGDGMRRLLGLAVFLVKSVNGYLFIDEIDTGLHHSTLEAMWQFVIQTAIRLDIQVFATTHSGDCVRTLAWLQADQPELAKHVVVHRVEANVTKSIHYSTTELEIAARHHIEVRG